MFVGKRCVCKTIHAFLCGRLIKHATVSGGEGSTSPDTVGLNYATVCLCVCVSVSVCTWVCVCVIDVIQADL